MVTIMVMVMVMVQMLGSDDENTRWWSFSEHGFDRAVTKARSDVYDLNMDSIK